MSDQRRRWLAIMTVAFLSVGLLACLAWPFVSIQLRLHRNNTIAQQLVRSLSGQFPGSKIHGAAAYDREVVYVTVIGQTEGNNQKDIEDSLRRLKSDLRIAPAIWLRFSEDSDDEQWVKF
jgi:hypothetical protein